MVEIMELKYLWLESDQDFEAEVTMSFMISPLIALSISPKIIFETSTNNNDVNFDVKIRILSHP